MITLRDLKPLQRQALPHMLDAPAHALVRCKGGYTTAEASPEARPVFTIRTVNALQADGLVDFDQPMFPTCITLSTAGVKLAEQLVRAQRDAAAKAGAA